LHGAFSVALDRKNPPPGQRIFLRGGKLKARARDAEKTLIDIYMIMVCVIRTGRVPLNDKPAASSQ
jgi:hypothetical protein